MDRLEATMNEVAGVINSIHSQPLRSNEFKSEEEIQQYLNAMGSLFEIQSKLLKTILRRENTDGKV